MVRTSVIPCLSSGLAKNNKIISLFVLFSQLFWPFKKFGFFSILRGTKLTAKPSDKMLLVKDPLS